MKEFKISERSIGQNHPAYIIAEIGMNHNGSVDLGKRHIEAAANAGADAVKFQTFHTQDFLSSRFFDYEERRKYELDAKAHAALKDFATSVNVEFLSSPFDQKSVDLLHDLGVGAFKIASSDLTNRPLLTYVASKGKPMLMSTGYADVSEIQRAYEWVRETQDIPLAILHCVAAYPTDPADLNLVNIPMINRLFSCVSGFSDHSLDYEVLPSVAVALGARIIEKHFTIDRNLPGYDHHFSLTPEMLGSLVSNIRMTENAMGRERLETGVISSERERREKARRSLYWQDNLKAGTKIETRHLIPKRPGIGLAPIHENILLGKVLRCDVEADTAAEVTQVE